MLIFEFVSILENNETLHITVIPTYKHYANAAFDKPDQPSEKYVSDAREMKSQKLVTYKPWLQNAVD